MQSTITEQLQDMKVSFIMFVKKRSLEGLKQVRAKEICDKGTSLISQLLKTFTLDQ